MRGILVWLLVLSTCVRLSAQAKERLPATDVWDIDGDPADRMVAGIDTFLLHKTEAVVAARDRFWQQQLASKPVDAFRNEQLERLRQTLGMQDTIETPAVMQRIEPVGAEGPLPAAAEIRLSQVRWEVLDDLWIEGWLLEPASRVVQFHVVMIPDATDAAKRSFMTDTGEIDSSAIGCRLARRGGRVVVMELTNRAARQPALHAISNREYLYRTAFGLGRHVIGYETQTALRAGEALRQANPAIPVWYAGHGDGGRIALYAAALDAQAQGVVASGAFGPREGTWQEPIDRNLFGLLNTCGDAELAAFIAPRPVLIETADVTPIVTGEGYSAPGTLRTIPVDEVEREFSRIADRAAQLGAASHAELLARHETSSPPWQPTLCDRWFAHLSLDSDTTSEAVSRSLSNHEEPSATDSTAEVAARQMRQLQRWDRWTQRVLEESPYVRAEYMKQLDFSSLEAYERSTASYREQFEETVIGRFDDPLLPPRPRSRLLVRQSHWTAYEVALDVWEDVFAYGILLMPHGANPTEKRPVVVCQHGLEGVPQDTIFKDHPAYHDFAARLADRGYIVFCPQNPYRFEHRFRSLQRKANPLGKSLFSIIIPQHRQIVAWLGSLPEVDPQRIGYYGLSYGGKSAMRIPAVVTQYALSICSADFNDWVWKLSSTRSHYSYVRTKEYEIFEFNLGSTFNYSEMAALIAPRPFMVERGHFDGVAPDDRVAAEFAKVRHLYAARLGLGDRAEIEWFVGPHTIHGQGTFEFLDRHLRHGGN